ncbi:hypothetical protein ELH94_14845 [Rhizobium leguminosarum]|uniref:hypothetical protein n=1 Tax=Rhizobium leguminosarum TaxID=384 RepID=UPI001030EEFE|nr:hypothetical protein [Rhizobium leguminosarum]TAX97703.1 hypothetical protein ELH94_14845 [Rhizobium leguminosarum]
MASQSWHRTEPREVRPFFVTISAEKALDQCGIRLQDDSEFSSESSFELDEIDFQKLALNVSLKVADPKTWLGGTLKPDDLELLLVVKHGFLKRSEVVHRIGLAAKLPARWSVDTETLTRLGGGRNSQVTLAICLASDKKPEPGAPFLPGHWLAKKTFVLRSRTMPTLFDLRIRTDEEWIAVNFPPKTFFAVEYTGGIDTELDEGASVATVWVHADAHSKLTTSSLGDVVQPLLASEIITAILLESHYEWKAREAVDERSPLANLLQKLGGENPMELRELQSLAGNPSKLRAVVQDRLSVLGALR